LFLAAAIPRFSDNRENHKKQKQYELESDFRWPLPRTRGRHATNIAEEAVYAAAAEEIRHQTAATTA